MSASAPTSSTASANYYPAALSGRLDPTLSRWKWLVKWFLAIPHYVALIGLGVAAVVVTVIAWFAILFTGRYPEGLYRFASGYLRFSLRAVSYLMLAVDVYPPFSGEEAPGYPVAVAIPERLASYSRLKTFFRMLYIIPAYIAVVVLGIGLYVCVVISWFTIIITGRDPFTDYKRFALGWVLKFAALFLLVVQEY